MSDLRQPISLREELEWRDLEAAEWSEREEADRREDRMLDMTPAADWWLVPVALAEGVRR